MLMQNFGVTNKEHYGMLWYSWSGHTKPHELVLQMGKLGRLLHSVPCVDGGILKERFNKKI